MILKVTDSKSKSLESARFCYVRKIWHLFPSLEHSSTKSTVLHVVNLYTSPFLSISTDECNLLVGQTAPSGYLSAYYGGMKKVGIVNWCKVKDSAHIIPYYDLYSPHVFFPVYISRVWLLFLSHGNVFWLSTLSIRLLTNEVITP